MSYVVSYFKPSTPYNVPVKLLTPRYETVKGVRKKIFPDDGELLYCSFKSYGGTERDVNGVYSIEDTASVETWYRPDITSECAIMLAESGKVYEIIGEPENINMRNQYCKFKVRRVKGDA